MTNRIKSRKTAVKRFKVSSTGKVLRNKTGKNHLMRKKDSGRRRTLSNDGILYPGDRKRITRMLGAGFSTRGPQPPKAAVEAVAAPETE